MEDFTIPLPHLTLAARRWHAGSAGKVLALHGWLDNAASFDRLAPLLPEHEVVALDLAGHGLSGERPPGAFYHFVDAVPDVVEAARSLGWERFSLLCHSMGAGIGPMVAAVLPAQVECLVCIEGLGSLTSPPEEAPSLLRRSLAHRLSDDGPPVYASLDDAVARLVKRGLTREGAECLARRGTRAVEGGLVFAYDPRVRWPSRARLTEEQVRAFLREVACPVLFVTAPDGLPYNWDDRTTCLRDVRRLTTTGGGHHLHLDHPELISREVRDFLTKKGRA